MTNSPHDLFALLAEHATPCVVQGFLRGLEIARDARLPLNLGSFLCGLVVQCQAEKLRQDPLDSVGIGLLRTSAQQSRGVCGYTEECCDLAISRLRRLVFLERSASPASRVSLARLLRRIAGDEALFQDAPEDRKLYAVLRASPLWEQLLALPDRADAAEGQPGRRPLPLGVDLVEEARQGRWLENPLVGREDVLDQLIVVLQARLQAPILLGDAGVGKSAVVEGLAYHIARNPQMQLSDEERSWRIIEISAADVLAGTGVQGRLEKRLKQLLEFAGSSSDVILYFDEIHALFDTTDDAARRIANTLKPKLARNLRCIGATTRAEFDKYLASDATLTDRFQPIDVGEPSRDEAIRILSRSKAALLGMRAVELGIDVADEALAAAVALSCRYQPTRRLPRKAFQLVRIAVQEKIGTLSRKPDSGADRCLTPRDIAGVLARYRKVPVDHILDPTGEKRFAAMRSAISASLIGQDHAVDAVVDQVRIHARGWTAPGRPIGVFLFLGPPGVGKSELARLLAQNALAEAAEPIVQDMSLFAGHGEMAISQLIGSSAGYVGYGDTTVFSRVRSRPHCVLVLDEIEKAPGIYPLLLGMFTGSAEDSRHLRTDFSQALIVLTSNALRECWGEGGLSDAELRRRLHEPAAGDPVFPPELIDRIDQVIMFNRLTPEVLLGVLDLQIRAREQQAGTPLPGPLSRDPQARAQFVARLLDKGEASGRTVARALDEYLRAATRPR